MNKEEFLAKLAAITRQVTCESESKFLEGFKDGTIKFDHFMWDEKAKIHTVITMKKIKVE